jgi:hypothetical protein
MNIIQRLLAALRPPAANPTEIPAELVQYIAAAEAMETAAAIMKRTRRPVARALKAARIANNLTIREVAKRVGISAPYYSDLENGLRRITPAVLKEMRKIFNL